MSAATSIRFFERRAEEVREFAEASGHALSLLAGALARLPQAKRRSSDVIEQMANASVRVLHVVLLVGAFSGMILTLQTGLELSRWGQQDLIGTIASLATVREMGPFITATILAATSGSALAAELATMAVSEELLALEVLSIDTTAFLVMPRVFALAVICPLLTIFVDAIGIVGGALVARFQLDVSFATFSDRAIEALRQTAVALPVPKDLYVGLFKAFVFGLVIATVACAAGMRAHGGAKGVGDATRRSVRNSIVLIIVFNYYITSLFYR
ncbi:MAG TPA: ABC transporter permease [Planctomycetota bacterium]|jgi:phospholipid/cholesterol/gamma-HCH transport system permease protein|nr:ABC transporter permease [Planctomycetota bacterium]